MPETLLFVGDVHLGRRPTRLPDNLDEFGLTPAQLSPAAAWRETVRYAVERGIAALVLAGDVVENENARFEAFGPLRDGVQRLVDAGVAVLAVSGNHDVNALSRLAEAVPGFRLLGRGGHWQTVEVEGANGDIAARVSGWSFPTERVYESPLGRGAPARVDPATLHFGVLHADLDQHGSPYAPITSAELQGAGLDGWFLGHVHKPSALDAPRPLGYLGSIVGLDPSESGAHGPWLVELERPLRVEQIPLAPLRWEEIEVPWDAVAATADDLQALVTALEGFDRQLGAGRGETRAVGCRVRLTGERAAESATPSRELLERMRALRLPLNGTLYFVERVRDATRAALDLEALARGTDPPALLARRVLALERRDESADAEIEGAVLQLRTVLGSTAWRALDPRPLTTDDVRNLLVEQGRRALETLLAQRPSSSGSATT